MDHHNIALIRGDRKNPSLRGPDLRAYEALNRRFRQTWALREKGRVGGIVEPMLQWAKMRTAREQRQVVACRAGIRGDLDLRRGHNTERRHQAKGLLLHG